MAVLVVGAGPAGLAAAVGLSAAGTPVRVVDAAPGPATTSRALGLQPRGVEVLDRLGALGDLPQRSVPLRGTTIRVDGRERLRLSLPSGQELKGRTALVISQTEIEAHLRDRFAALGGAIEWGKRLVGLTQDTAGVAVVFADDETFRCDWLIGCDGASSTVRRAIGVQLVGETAEERFLLADARVRLPVPRDFASMWAATDGPLAAIPLPGTDHWRLMAPNPFGQPDDLPAAAVVRVLSDLLCRRIGESAMMTEVSWTSEFRIHRRLAASYRRDRVLLAGDAAHVHSPVGGQGMNTGLGDAENLAWKLALVYSGRAGETLIDSYEMERRPVAAAVVNTVSGVDKLLLSKNLVVGLIRDRMLLPLVGLPSIQRWIWRKSSQLDITYRNGPLAQRPNFRRAGLRSGDRVPDLIASRADDRPTRLHAELGGRWALVSADRDVSAGIAKSVCQRLGGQSVSELASASVAAGRILLVRPDGHLGWQGSTDPASASRWLDGILGR
jgi:2-polyprenyl-6-methoxyphenol hydroxylase-like FAD-dependent oxidoreductase